MGLPHGLDRRPLSDGVRVFFDQILQRAIIHGKIGIQAFEFRQFALCLLEPLEIRRLEPHVLRFPVVGGGITHPMLTAKVFDFDAAIPLLQDRNNLGFAESTGFHENLLGA